MAIRATFKSPFNTGDIAGAYFRLDSVTLDFGKGRVTGQLVPYATADARKQEQSAAALREEKRKAFEAARAAWNTAREDKDNPKKESVAKATLDLARAHYDAVNDDEPRSLAIPAPKLFTIDGDAAAAILSGKDVRGAIYAWLKTSEMTDAVDA